jgi:lysozyme family protein
LWTERGKSGVERLLYCADYAQVYPGYIERRIAAEKARYARELTGESLLWWWNMGVIHDGYDQRADGALGITQNLSNSPALGEHQHPVSRPSLGVVYRKEFVAVGSVHLVDGLNDH